MLMGGGHVDDDSADHNNNDDDDDDDDVYVLWQCRYELFMFSLHVSIQAYI